MASTTEADCFRHGNCAQTRTLTKIVLCFDMSQTRPMPSREEEDAESQEGSEMSSDIEDSDEGEESSSAEEDTMSASEMVSNLAAHNTLPFCPRMFQHVEAPGIG